MSSIPTLKELYKQHAGKVSDKWEIYLHSYDRIFSEFRNDKIRLLEIGIQNGGSLEIWSKYFTNFALLVGCDINKKCGNLKYINENIHIIVGDANEEKTIEKIKKTSNEYDIIIDDGSHLSSDIIKSFINFFPTIKYGGLFVVEDLHCSYWKEYQGGFRFNYSSIEFFKLIIDVINHEHFNKDNTLHSIISEFTNKYEIKSDLLVLSEIHSIEFINSMCIIRKKPQRSNLLGPRFISGYFEEVAPGHLNLHGSDLY